jgi:hypothetical protein
MAGTFLDQKKAQAIKLLGKTAKFPKEKGDFGKLIKDVDDKGKAFFKTGLDFAKAIAEFRGAYLDLESALRQTGQLYKGSDFGIDAQSVENLKNVAQAQKMFAETFDAGALFAKIQAKDLGDMFDKVNKASEFTMPDTNGELSD